MHLVGFITRTKGMPLWLLDEQRDCSGLRWYWQFAKNCRCFLRSVAFSFAEPVNVIAG